jgi:hypothetical protein
MAHLRDQQTNETDLTTWSRVLLEKLIVTQLVKKYLGFYGTPKFITGFTRAAADP